MNEKELLHNMKKKKNWENNIEEYISHFSSLYYDYASIQLGFSYYTVYEMLNDEASTKWIDEIVNRLNQCLSLSSDEAKSAIYELRNDVMSIMNNITLYTDILSIYEHIMNRVEYRFIDCTVPDLEYTKTKIQQFIFGDKDAVVTNDKIKKIVSELPIRMTKQRFYDILTDSLSIYKDSDEAGVDGFVYMLRTIAGLQKDLKPVTGMQDMTEFIDSCEGLDYKTITKEQFDIIKEKLNGYAEQLTHIVGIYMQLQECINHYYTMLLCDNNACYKEHAGQTAIALMTEIRDHFDDDTETVLDRCATYLEELEGKQEDIMERVMGYEALLMDISSEYNDNEQIHNLDICSKLVSTSIFVDLKEDAESVPVTTEYINQATTNLIEEFSQFFKEHSQIVNRAVMSLVLGSVPVFFNNTQEITDYIDYALTNCGNDSELCASLNIIDQIME